MDARFAGKVVLITGGNSGIGLAAARAFAREGARLALIGRNRATLASAAAALGAETLALVGDVTQPQALQRLVAQVGERFGRIDVLFANAGVGAILPIEEVTEQIWDQVIDVNLKGVFFSVRSALPLMGRGGNIVLNASLGAQRCPPHFSVYAASKAGVVALGRTLALELVERGIRVNVVSPGPVKTALPEHTLGSAVGSLPQLQDEAHCTPMGRIGSAEEAAAAVLFLASDAASFITGVDLVVDGGITTT
jgi:NAD(P)-dependent dehydrogenase (short-subunit alcohol dehydrogenase family)